MKNKFFPTFQRYIRATAKLLMLAISFFGVITLTIFGAYSAYNAVTEFLKAYEAAEMELGRSLQENHNVEENKKKYESPEGASTIASPPGPHPQQFLQF